MIPPIHRGASHLPPAAAAPAPSPADDTALLAGLPAHSPLAGLRQDLRVTARVVHPSPHAAAFAAGVHHGHTLDGLRPLRRPGDTV